MNATRKKALVILAVTAYLMTLSAFSSAFPVAPGFGERRTVVLTGLMDAIKDAQAQGTYSCCIDPPCTMCYLGGWIWEDGVCRCDEMIASGQLEKVCPQCQRGLEDGLCKSAGGPDIKCETEDI